MTRLGDTQGETRLELRASRRIAAAGGGAAGAPPDVEARQVVAVAALASSHTDSDSDQDQQAWEEATDAPAGQALEHASVPRRIPSSSLATFPMPPPCAFLRPGQAFEGRQRVAHHHGAIPKQEHWKHYDPASGYVAGTMEASSVPGMPGPVTTFFEGEIVDNQHNTFVTADWDACADTDFQHWSKFAPFRQIHAEVVRHNGRCPSLAAHPYVYMRWKEQFFLHGSECRLTIAGFYYLAVNRSSGKASGYYYDPSSSPDQKLSLTAVRSGPAGYAFPHYDLA